MVTAAAKRMPLPLIEQLAPGGIMIIPVGPLGWQELMQVTKDSEGNIEQKKLLDVAFVELVGKYS
jgi:protein-L-isoaspartate(D-aspartate) O-methyltransferase